MGFLLVAACAYGWVREDAREIAREAPRAGTSDYWVGTIIFIIGEVLLFGTLFAYWFWARAYTDGPWPPADIPSADMPLVTLNTVVLLGSGVAAHFGETALRKGNVARFRRLILTTLVLGVVFLLGQAYEYATAGFLPSSGPYGTAFFALTGVHGLHVFVGLVVLGSVLALERSGIITPARASGAGGAVLYWHFVDAVWVVLFIVVYAGGF